MRFFALIIFLLPSLAWSEDLASSTKKAILLGHNVTPSAETMTKNTWSIGNYAIAYAPSDEFFFATSPWIWTSYNTANFHVKGVKPINEKSSAGFFASYFHSYASAPLLPEINNANCGPGNTNCSINSPAGGGHGPLRPLAVVSGATVLFEGLARYQWQSANLHLLYSYQFTERTKTHVNLHYAYFWNDDMPYSIRMDPGSDNIRGQVDLTTLTNFHLSETAFHINTELGIVGLNYIQPYAQLGVSIAYLSERWLFQLGGSYTARFAELNKSTAWTPGRYDPRVHISLSDGQSYYWRYLQTAIHPELHIQYFF